MVTDAPEWLVRLSLVRKSSAVAVPCTAAKLLTPDEARHIALNIASFYLKSRRAVVKEHERLAA
jgi:hypothetical protein